MTSRQCRVPDQGGPRRSNNSQMHSAVWVSDLTDNTKGSDVAQQHLNTLLSEMFPASTLPTGSQKLSRLGAAANIDMQTSLKTGWPADRGILDWKHSDIREVAYPFVHRAFEAMVQLGDLK